MDSTFDKICDFVDNHKWAEILVFLLTFLFTLLVGVVFLIIWNILLVLNFFFGWVLWLKKRRHYMEILKSNIKIFIGWTGAMYDA